MTVRPTYLMMLFMAFMASITGTVWAQQKLYTTKSGDTMSSIAVRYYSTPDAAQALYQYNEQAFSDAYERNRLANPAFNAKKNPKGKTSIFPDTQIRIPQELISATKVVYPSRYLPMDEADARAIAKKQAISIADAREPLIKQKPAWLSTPPAAPPPQGSPAQVSMSAQAATRESRPSWYASPSTPLQTCAKSICDRYATLCFYECVAVARRFNDAGVLCSNLPDELPYVTNPDGRKDCSAALQ